MNEKSFIRHTIFPIITALIWGTAFVAQNIASEFIRPLTFNAVRSFIAVFILFFVYKIFGKYEEHYGNINWKQFITGSIGCGILLTAASNLQQFGISETSVGKSGFITALYIVIVPLLGLFSRKKPKLYIWISVAIATVGLYFLCINNEFTLESADIYLLLCAVVFSLHIVAISHFTKTVNGILLSLGQFVVVGILSSTLAFFFEEPCLQNLPKCILPVLYVSIFSSGVAYTLQIIAQKGANPAKISLLLSFEAVFSVLGAAVIIGEKLTKREYFGCVLMFIAVILSQINLKKKR